MAETVEEPEHFRRAKERAQGERLKQALEMETGAHRALAKLYGECLDELSVKEEKLEEAQAKVEKLRKRLDRHKANNGFLKRLAAALAIIILMTLGIISASYFLDLSVTSLWEILLQSLSWNSGLAIDS